MAAPTVIIHSGALGDLALFLGLILRLPRAAEQPLRLVSRVGLGQLHEARPRIDAYSTESLGIHRLFADGALAVDPVLLELVGGARVLHNLGDSASLPHRRLVADSAAAGVFGIDTRCRGGCAHITAQWEADLNQQGLLLERCIAHCGARTTLRLGDAHRLRGRQVCEQTGIEAEPIVIHIGSGGAAKRWPIASFADVAMALVRQGQPCVIAAGPVERECVSAEEIERLHAIAPFVWIDHAEELLAWAGVARLWIGNDAGPSHVAALLGTPTATLFGPTSATRWRPLGTAAHYRQGRASAGSDWGLRADELGRWVAGIVSEA
ncbi:MAG: glycosyltransferase family 9 protein [Phycisphaerales bacterium]|nr:glycosyltransferase family 9 protein [Phycisphaerales bacterium]